MTDYDTALEALKASTEEMVSANQIAPILHMNPGVIVKYAKDGTWNQDTLGKFVISGDRVKFFRRDFLQKCGFLQPDPEKPTQEDMFWKIWELLADIRILVKAIANDKTAGAATPTVSGKDCQHEQS